MKHKRFKNTPKYNPAAERVRQRATWMEQVIAEEQNKPLELPSDTYKDLIRREVEEHALQQRRITERHEKIRKARDELQDKESRRMRYRQFLVAEERKRRQNGKAGTLDAIYGTEVDLDPAAVGMSVDAIVTLQKLDRLEQRVKTILQAERAMAPEALELDLTQALDVGVSAVQGADSATLNAEQITFVKRRTEPRAHAPSKVFYPAKVLSPSAARKRAIELRTEYASDDVPAHVVAHMQAIEAQRDAQNSRGATSAGQSHRPRTQEELREAREADDNKRRHEKDLIRQQEASQQERQDEVIKEWCATCSAPAAPGGPAPGRTRLRRMRPPAAKPTHPLRPGRRREGRRHAAGCASARGASTSGRRRCATCSAPTAASWQTCR